MTVDLAALQVINEGARELNRQAMILRQKILAFESKDKTAMLRYTNRAADETRKLYALLNVRTDTKMGEPAVSGVPYTTTPYQTLLVPADDLQKAEGF